MVDNATSQQPAKHSQPEDPQPVLIAAGCGRRAFDALYAEEARTPAGGRTSGTFTSARTD